MNASACSLHSGDAFFAPRPATHRAAWTLSDGRERTATFCGECAAKIADVAGADLVIEPLQKEAS